MNCFFGRAFKRMGLLALLLMVFAAMGMAQTVAGSVSPVFPPPPIGVDYVLGGPTSWSTSTRTVTNTGTDTMKAEITPTIQTGGAWNGYYYIYNSLTFQVDITKVSGTLGGTITLYGTNEPIANVSGYVQLASYSITTVTPQYYSKVLTGNSYTNYLQVFQGTGTEVATYYGTLLER